MTNPYDFKAESLQIGNIVNAIRSTVDNELLFKDHNFPEGIRLIDFVSAQAIDNAISLVNIDITKNANDITTLTSLTSSISAGVDGNTEAINTLSLRIDTNDNDIITITSLIADLSGSSDLTNLTIRVTDLENASSIHTSSISALTSANSTINNNINSLQETKLDSSVFASVSGSFLTSDDDSSFATKSQLSSVSGDLQSQLDSINVSVDISSYVDPISASLQTQIWSNESNIQTKLDSSVFASVSGSFLTSDDDSSFATKSQLSSVSGDLQSQLDSIDISGDISSYVDPISASLQTQIWSNESNIQTKLDSSVFASVSGSFLTSDDDSSFATKSELNSVSGDLQSQLDSIDISGDISSYVDPISASLQTQIWSNESNIQTKLDSSVFASVSGSFLTSDDDSSFATKSELNSVSGDLQSQLDSIDISGDISSYVDPISASLQTQIWSNESNIQTKLDSSVFASVSGSFLTSDDDSSFATKSELNSVSGDLQSQLDSIDISGDISSYVDPISASLQTQIWSNESNIQTKLDSSVFASVSGSFLTSDDDSSFATKSELNSVSGDLQSQIASNDNQLNGLISISGSLHNTLNTIIADLSGANSYVTFVGDASSKSFNIEHNLSSQYVDVNVYDAVSRDQVHPFINVSDLNNIYISFNSSPTLNQYVVKVDSNVNSRATITSINQRVTVSGTTPPLAQGDSYSLNIEGFKTYALMKIETSTDAWVRVYSNDISRSSDASRNEFTDPLPNAGVIAEVITNGPEVATFTPSTIGFNDENPTTYNIPIAITNKNAITQPISLNLTILRLE